MMESIPQAQAQSLISSMFVVDNKGFLSKA